MNIRQRPFSCRMRLTHPVTVPMPPKSTYFYPKVLSGLVINPLSD